MDDCFFCDIVAKKLTTKILFENNEVLAFPDINPVAPVHVLIIPKRHLPTVLDLGKKDDKLLYQILAAACHLVKEKKLAKMKYRLVFNGGAAQHVPHLHWHLLAGDIADIPE